jgi:hypothetical protein
MSGTPPHKPNKIHGNRIDFNLLFLPKKQRLLIKQNPVRRIIGFDTETLDGATKLICDSQNRHTVVKGIDNTLDFLFYKNYRHSINFFYNLQYDTDGIIKMLPKEQFIEIATTNKTTYNGYNLKIIPKKLFQVSRDKHAVKYYDLAQFFNTSLENAAQTYLNEGKMPTIFTREELGSSREIWNKYLPEIIQYCTKDAMLTMRLGEILQSEYIGATGIAPSKYLSQSSLAKQYFRRVCQIPSISKIPRPILKTAFESYYGGRFECTSKGNIGHGYEYDITSAYPYQISNLLDITKGEWKKVSDVHPNAAYGFYLTKVSQMPEKIQYLPLRQGTGVLYPAGEWTGYYTKDELLALPGYDDYQVLYGYEFYPSEEIYPFCEAIYNLFDKKNSTPKSDYRYDLYKKIMNSLYGCFYEKYVVDGGRIRCGVLFNPIYASIITAKTRVQLLNFIKGHHKIVESFATDSIISTKKLLCKNEETLGDFTLKSMGKTVILRSGIYSIGEKLRQRGVMKARVFKTPYGAYENLFDYITDYPDLTSYPLIVNRPLHSKESLSKHLQYNKNDINKFLSFEYEIDLNHDYKRDFIKKNISGRELIKSSYKSKSYVYFDEQWHRQ